MSMEIQTDVMDAARAGALQVALGKQATVRGGTALPPFFHHLYFWTPQPPGQLGRDGHPKVGGLIPDMGLPRRMWAGGRLEFFAPLIAGQLAERRSLCESSSSKSGRTGPLGFVTLRHEVWQSGALRLTEWQDLVYRQDPSADTATPPAPLARQDETEHRELSFDSTMLFRYSALTFNGHRIHYDIDYARDVEGYAGLVVHGPLLAQHLMLFAEDVMGPLAQFSFRATSALMHFETASLCRRGNTLWVRAADGRQCMIAEASA
ncbi:acyl dehydratase [Ruegeria faecimaris]|uniref:acyl dehydratase n=1 Tax=Ruegeria faecimaris TaxID=686389 RepID=UPI00232E79F2|nr:acyl dehydratase [Ruegeria faecimaris]